MVQTGAAGLQSGQRDQGAVFGRRGANGAIEEISTADGPFAGADESEQLRDGIAVVRGCQSGATDAAGMGGVCAGDAGDFVPGERRARRVGNRTNAVWKAGTIECGAVEVSH